ALPAAQWIDQRERRFIIVGGVTVWSVMTIASAFAVDFATLAFCRVGVAIGEAVLIPAAISLIADMFTRERRALPVSVFMAVAGTMGFGSFIVSAAAYDLAKHLSPAFDLAAWRLTFIIVGIPGIVLALLFLFTAKEPARVVDGRESGAEEEASFPAFIALLKRDWMFFLPYFVAIAAAATCAYAKLAWVPALAMRAHDVSPSAIGYMVGISGVATGLFGSFFWPWFASFLTRRGVKHSLMACLVLSMVLVTPLLIVAPLSPTALLLIGGMTLTTAGLGTCSVLSPLVMQTYGPARMRARLMAVVVMSISLVGLSIGPVLTPVIASFWPEDKFALGYGLSILAAAAGPISILAYIASWLSLLRRRTAGEETLAPA
ncbi:MAG: MFS transporter, partial [Hyphomonadaceae bacterium]